MLDLNFLKVLPPFTISGLVLVFRFARTSRLQSRGLRAPSARALRVRFLCSPEFFCSPEFLTLTCGRSMLCILDYKLDLMWIQKISLKTGRFWYF